MKFLLEVTRSMNKVGSAQSTGELQEGYKHQTSHAELPTEGEDRRLHDWPEFPPCTTHLHFLQLASKHLPAAATTPCAPATLQHCASPHCPQ